MTTRTLILAAALAAALPLTLPAADAPAKDAKPAVAAKAPEPCKESGSRIQHKDGNCGAFGPYRSYDQKDLQNTGETNLAEALRKIDPIFH